jgi:hypothetical protein
MRIALERDPDLFGKSFEGLVSKPSAADVEHRNFR